MTVLCLGCHQEFDEFEAFQRHRANAEHPDKGEAYKSATENRLDW